VARPNQGEIAEIDGLRGVAILMVMIHRLWPREAVNRRHVAAGDCGIGGDLFFVVSGFLITRILLDTRGDSGYFRNFYARRVLRIFPLYYLFVTAVMLAFPMNVSPLWFLTFLGNIPESLLGTDPAYWLAPVWSLAIEEQFYLTFPWIVAWLGEKRLGRFLVGLFLLAPLVRLVTMLAWPEQERIQYLFTLCRVDAIAAGCLVALILRWRHAGKLRDLALMIACCAGAVAVIGDLDRTTDFGRVLGYSFVAIIFSALLVAVMNGLGDWWTAPLRLRALRYLGRLCFGLYLLHRPADTITTALAERAGLDASRISWIPIKLLVAVALATATWLLIERPILRLKRFFVSARHPSALAAIALLVGCHGAAPMTSPWSVAAVGRPGGKASHAVIDAMPASLDAPSDAPAATPPQHVVYPSDRTQSPITPDVVARLQAIAGTGDRHVFMKIGDSITATPDFLSCFEGVSNPTVDYFAQGRIAGVSPFTRQSSAAHGGWTTADLLEGTPCALDSELAAATPSIGVIMLGTNDNRLGRTLDDFALDLWAAVDAQLLAGVVPVLSTIPALHSYPQADARVPLFNDVVRAIAQGRQVPLVDLHRELASLPNDGISSDGIHPTVAPSGACDLSAAYGYNVRNKVTLDALGRVRDALDGTASDASASTLPALPYTDIVDTRGRPDLTACGDTMGGVEIELDVPQSRTLDIRVIGRAESIAVEQGGTCIVDGMRHVSAAVASGPVRLVVRGGTGESIVIAR